MNILFRVDASSKIGTGHVMRCLTLAHQLKQKGASISFICREEAGNLCDYIEQEGFRVFRLHAETPLIQQQDAQETAHVIKTNFSVVDWGVVDHYQFDQQWEQIISGKAHQLMVIDDLANRLHTCDLLLDQNYYTDYLERYEHLVPEGCLKLLGPQYLLLRDEFLEAQDKVDIRDGSMKRILIFYGGSDPTNETEKVVRAFQQLKIQDIHIDVVTGTANPNRTNVEHLCKESRFTYHCQINYLADLISQADVAFGAGGVTMWERCFLGLPSIVTIVAENQKASTEAAAAAGAVWNLGWHEDIKESDYAGVIQRALKEPEKLKELSLRSIELMNSNGQQKVHPAVDQMLKGS
ncbi:UDP-2,4-diacetamido-2,4,6-trideoxy-beta-L-altropyranose hydrolase [Bacillus tianshenii]|nr:UDP-2,4-diacetamido-2,4,6-trideoxy-beta-L-altropyranose hydrolase [Bacillus tianshenii]